MTHRFLTDTVGRTWQVWAVRPTAPAGVRRTALAPEFRDGWLTFERLSPRDASPLADPAAPQPAKRRHASIAPGWEGAPDAALHAWLALAAPVVRGPSRADRPAHASAPAPPLV